MIEYGSIEKAYQAAQKAEEQKKELEERKADLEKINKKSRTKEQQAELDDLSKTLKGADSFMKRFEPLYQKDEKGKTVKDEKGKPVMINAQDMILSAEDIMNLDPVTRAYMLQRGSAKYYNATHQNKEKIDKLALEAEDLQHKIDALEEKKAQWMSTDGKAKKGHNKQVIRTDKQIKTLQEEQNKKNREIDKEKNRHRTERIYSEEQQDIIDDLVNQGTQEDTDFLDKVIDIGRLQSALDRHQKEYQEVLTNPEAFHQYVGRAKQRAKRDLMRRRAERIADIEDFKEYSQQLDELLAGASQDEQRYVRSILDGIDRKRAKERE